MTRPTVRFITAKEAATYLRVTPKTIYELCKRDEMPHVRVGNSIRIPLEPFNRWVREHTSGLLTVED